MTELFDFEFGHFFTGRLYLHRGSSWSSQELLKLSTSLLLIKLTLLVTYWSILYRLNILLHKPNGLLIVFQNRAHSYWIRGRLLLLIIVKIVINRLNVRVRYFGLCRPIESVTLLEHILFALLVIAHLARDPVALFEAMEDLLVSLLNHLEAIEAVAERGVTYMVIGFLDGDFFLPVLVSTRCDLIFGFCVLTDLLFDTKALFFICS